MMPRQIINEQERYIKSFRDESGEWHSIIRLIPYEGFDLDEKVLIIETWEYNFEIDLDDFHWLRGNEHMLNNPPRIANLSRYRGLGGRTYTIDKYETQGVYNERGEGVRTDTYTLSNGVQIEIRIQTDPLHRKG